jgi:hypothetical protein
MSDEPSTEVRSSYAPVAVVAGVVGLISFIFAPAGIVAVLLGHIGLWRVSRSKSALRGRGLCIFALVLGYLALAVMIYLNSKR